MSSCRQELVTVTNFGFAITECMQIERQGSKGVYVRVFHDLELLRYVLRCAIERQL